MYVIEGAIDCNPSRFEIKMYFYMNFSLYIYIYFFSHMLDLFETSEQITSARSTCRLGSFIAN